MNDDIFEGVHSKFPIPPEFQRIPRDLLTSFRFDIERVFSFPSIDGRAVWIAVVTVTSPNANRAMKFLTSFDDLSELTNDLFNDEVTIPISTSTWADQYRLQCQISQVRLKEVSVEIGARHDLKTPHGQRAAVLELLDRGAAGEWLGNELEDSRAGTLLYPHQIAVVLQINVADTRELLSQMFKDGELIPWGSTYAPKDYGPSSRQLHRHRFWDYLIFEAKMRGPSGPADLPGRNLE
jgi:hypothetical protein